MFSSNSASASYVVCCNGTALLTNASRMKPRLRSLVLRESFKLNTCQEVAPPKHWLQLVMEAIYVCSPSRLKLCTCVRVWWSYIHMGDIWVVYVGVYMGGIQYVGVYTYGW